MMIDALAQQSGSHATDGQTGFAGGPLPLADASLTGLPLADEIDPEVLHRLRISLRRLRAVWSSYARQLGRGMNTRERALYRYLAAAVGKTRDWDVLITLLAAPASVAEQGGALSFDVAPGVQGEGPPANPTQLRAMLHDAVRAARFGLDSLSPHAALRRSADDARGAPGLAAGRALRRATALRVRGAKRADHAAFNDVRRAGTRLTYLIEFFRPALACHERDVARHLKRIHKRFGKLNDVVACEALLRENPGLLPDGDVAYQTLASLQRERRRRMRAASRLLATC